jgi:dihydrofolate reductase
LASISRGRASLAAICGRKLYETMLVWETDPSLRDTELHAEFADVWCALPKIVFSRTLDSAQGNARLAEGSVAEEVAATLAATSKDVEIGGASLAATAIELGLVDELRMLRHPIVVGGGTPFLPPVTEDVPLGARAPTLLTQADRHPGPWFRCTVRLWTGGRQLPVCADLGARSGLVASAPRATAETSCPRVAGQMRRPAQKYLPIGKQVRLRMIIALGSLCSTTVDMGSCCGEAGAEARAPRRSIGAER